MEGDIAVHYHNYMGHMKCSSDPSPTWNILPMQKIHLYPVVSGNKWTDWSIDKWEIFQEATQYSPVMTLMESSGAVIVML